MKAKKLLTISRKSKQEDKQEKNKKSEYRQEILKKIELSSFLLGSNDKNWKVCFDWIIENDKNYIKILEGKYE